MTLSGVFGNGLVALSLASTSIVAEAPRWTTAVSGAGCASGLVDGTTINSMVPDVPIEFASRTPIVISAVVPAGRSCPFGSMSTSKRTVRVDSSAAGARRLMAPSRCKPFESSATRTFVPTWTASKSVSGASATRRS